MKRRLLAVVATALIVGPSLAHATPQVNDTLVFGGRKYSIHQIPMLGFWDYGEGSTGTGTEPPPRFDVQSSANWAGYKATWEITDSKLRLRRITGSINGKQVSNEAILKGRRFPVVADWFTGRIHLPVGDFNPETGEITAVIVFHIDKGHVTRMSFLESAQPVFSWNGLNESRPDEKVESKENGIPAAVLKQLRPRIGDLKLGMSEGDAIEALGLSKHRAKVAFGGGVPPREYFLDVPLADGERLVLHFSPRGEKTSGSLQRIVIQSENEPIASADDDNGG